VILKKSKSSVTFKKNLLTSEEEEQEEEEEKGEGEGKGGGQAKEKKQGRQKPASTRETLKHKPA
jgi:hypothetical protein